MTRRLSDYHVGQIFRTETIDVTEEEIISFATRYDPQVFHTDPVAAKNTFFKGLAASGWLTAALAMRLFIRSELAAPGEMIGGEIENLRWTQPVRPGDVRRLEIEILSLAASRSKPNQAWVYLSWSVFNQKNEIVLTLKTRTMFKIIPE